MSILCAGGCHVYRINEARCTCGQNLTKFPLSGGVIPSYNPFGPPRPPTPPTAGQAPDVSIGQFKAAQLSGASHLSADGRYVFTIRYGQTLQAKWDEWAREFGAWEPVDEMPADTVKM